MGALDRLLSLGHSDAIPDRLARHVRLTNALALFGVVIALSGLAIDVFGSSAVVVVEDVISIGAFAACWVLNARGRRTAARVMLATAANFSLFGGVMGVAPVLELRTLFFPLAILPFLLFGPSERLWLATFVAIPVAEYFVAAAAPPPVGTSLSQSVYLIYSPVLAFSMIIGGGIVFLVVERQIEKRFVGARELAAHKARLAALGEMSSGIAHELRNPLAAIHLAASQIAEHPEQTAQVARLGERVRAIVMRATRTIDALRTFGRDAADDPFVETRVDRVVRDALDLCRKRFREHGVAVTVDVAPELTVECRPVQMTQVLLNLMSNAFDAVAESAERWVRVEARTTEEHLELAVSDSGPGVPEAVRRRLFEPFFTTKGPERGTGIGLSLSRGLVAAHGGTLELDTASERTRFVVRLPRVQTRSGGETR